MIYIIIIILIVALMESMRSLDTNNLLLNRDQYLDLASSLNEFFAQHGLIKSELDPTTVGGGGGGDTGVASHPCPMVPQPQMSTPPQPISFQIHHPPPNVYQNYPPSDDQASSPGATFACQPL